MDASIVAYRLGEIMLAQSASGMAHYLRDQHTIAHSHFNDCLFMRLLLQGRLRGRFGDEQVDIKRGDIYLTDMAQVSELWLAEDCRHISVMLPRSRVDDMAVHGKLLHGEWLPCRMLREHLIAFVEVLRDCSDDTVTEMIKATLELLRFCLRTGETSSDRQPAEDARERIVRYIDQHLADGNLGALRLQQVFGISRAQLYRQFAELGGVKHYILNKRLQAVLHDLCHEPHQNIVTIIGRYGFSSERQFQRAFRGRFGMTASQVRAGWQYKAEADDVDGGSEE
ncbi:helix-turn-helix domain-containing protein [Dyella sp. 7MK23]|uniref:Helix-turn-helix domain-containing protein n=1 Tax=Dyella acidiphila TaxID=2775866 RepID=A0ABR9GE07_9GAMM|nr:helix-turn-helix domain-containing protein [Dyella acidiphila]